jgi:N-acetylglucosaminyl-diphospho-decaprenol L-rhamnosyltransferase
MPRTLIVILNFRTAGLACDCLTSLALDKLRAGDYRVVVVDNNSADGSAETIAKHVEVNGWGTWARVLARSENDGFAAGNNAAIGPALSETPPYDYFLLLNPDTVVHEGAVAALVQFLEKNPQAGLAGSRLEDPDGAPQNSAFRFPGILSELERAMRFGVCSRLLAKQIVAPPVRNEIHRTDWVAGASLLVRRQVFEKVGLMDSSYFLYFEEVDFCLRAQRAGWECWYVPESRVVHLEGQATGLKSGSSKRKRMPGYWFASRRRYFEKNHGRFYARLTDLSWLSGHLLWRARRFVQRKPDDDAPYLLQDFCRGSFIAPRGSK